MTKLQKKCFNILATSFNVLHNHFDGPNKIIVDLAKFLDNSKLFSFCVQCCYGYVNFMSKKIGYS